MPFDEKRLVFPPFPGLIIGLILYQPLRFFDYSKIIVCGGLLGYLTYDLTHYFIHHGSPKPNSFFYNLKRTHHHHHFTAHDKGRERTKGQRAGQESLSQGPAKTFKFMTNNVFNFFSGFGISSPLWDIVFSTKIILKKLKFVLKW